MADYTTTKPAGTGVLESDGVTIRHAGQFPDGAVSSPWGRLEPLLTPDLLKSRYLKAIPMVLKIKDPATGKPYTITDDEIKDYIDRALGDAEGQTGLTLIPTQMQQKLAYSKLDFDQWGYFQLDCKPVASIESLTVCLADGSQAFQFPLEWCEVANLVRGQLNIIPLAFQGLAGGQGFTGNSATGNAVWWNVYWNRPNVPALFGIVYTAGFKDGLLPKMLNDLVGCIAAMRVLSQIAAAYAHVSSSSLGMDGMSQSVSTPGPQRYVQRMQELEAERKDLIKKAKKALRSGIVVGSV